MEKLTTIQLTDKEAKLFIEFRKYRNQLKTLLDSEFMGNVTFHKDGTKIRVIETTVVERFK